MRQKRFRQWTRQATKGGSLYREAQVHEHSSGQHQADPPPVPGVAGENGSNSGPEGLTEYLKDAIMSRLCHEGSLDTGRIDTTERRKVQEMDESAMGRSCWPGSPRNPPWKRIFDLCFVALTLPIWLPVMTLIMLAIKLLSPGPVFYRQRRIGLGGRRFMIFKFRSMRVNAETECHQNHLQHLMRAGQPMTKLDAMGDPRLIPWGKFFRASGLDELPQIFNIIKGEMSLVGPRPCTVHEFEHYEAWQRERFNVLPGLTGFWQVNGKNETTFNEMISMDIYYARTLSPLCDLAILLKTLPVVLSQIEQSQKPRGHRRMRNEPLRPASMKQS